MEIEPTVLIKIAGVLHMREVRKFGLGLAALCCVSGPALALNQGDSVDNFRLTDDNGVSHELYYLSDMKAVVLMAQGNGCDAARSAADVLGALRQKYQAQGVEFLAIDSNLKDTPESVAKEAALTKSKIPVLLDSLQLIGESLGITRNGEVLVLDPRNWHVIYRGAAAAGSNHYVADALDAALIGAPVKVAQSEVHGCPISHAGARSARSACADLLRKDHCAHVERALRGLPPRGRNRALADVEL